jgi:hypothetical protein
VVDGYAALDRAVSPLTLLTPATTSAESRARLQMRALLSAACAQLAATCRRELIMSCQWVQGRSTVLTGIGR